MEINIGNIIVEDEVELGSVELDVIREFPKLEDLTVTPMTEKQIFNHPDSYGYDIVTVEAVETETLNIKPTDEIQNYTGLYGNVSVDKINTEEKSEKLDFSQSDVIEISPSENSYLKKVTIEKDEGLVAENIKSGVDIFGVSGTGEILDAEINDMSYLFYNGARFNVKDELLKLVKSPTSMYNAFNGCKDAEFTSFDFSNIDTSKVESFATCFKGATNLTDVDVSDLDTSSATTLNAMFQETSIKGELDLRHCDMSKITNMHSFLRNCSRLTRINLNGCDLNNVTVMANAFYWASYVTDLDLGGCGLSNVTDMGGMLQGCSRLKNLNVAGLSNQVVKSTSSMFSGCGLTDIDLSWIYCNALTTVSSMFYSCGNLTNLIFMNDLGKAYTQKTKNYSSYKLDLHFSNNLTHDSLMDVINKLYDLNLTYNVANGGTLYTQQLIIGADNIAKLTSDELNIATNKGWVVS